ncbi:MAG: ribosome-associated translation inhibitor RaiA [Candidatus Pacebacteria bacterium]|nr:ribosome-associated translation inhibitor RaiA [Candidatus Paceibacterota bacterium]
MLLLPYNQHNKKLMNVIIKGTNLELHEDLKAYVNEKIGGLKKFIENENIDKSAIMARVELAKTTQHHQQGDIYKAEVNLQMTKKMLRVVVESDDIYKAIDEVKDKLKVAITDYKDEKNTKIRKGARIIKKLKNISPLAWAKGEFKKYKNRREE